MVTFKARRCGFKVLRPNYFELGILYLVKLFRCEGREIFSCMIFKIPSKVAFSGIFWWAMLYPNEEKLGREKKERIQEISDENEMRKMKRSSWITTVHCS